VNGWTSEVWLGDGGFFYHHRAFHTRAVPADFADAKHDLQSAQDAADRAVPAHECRMCGVWTAWRWCPQERRAVVADGALHAEVASVVIGRARRQSGS
jgi:hypothetical protein